MAHESVFIPVLVSSSSLYAQAEALEKEAAQLKAQAFQIRGLDGLTADPRRPSNISSDSDSYGDSPWQSPNTTPRAHNCKGENTQCAGTECAQLVTCVGTNQLQCHPQTMTCVGSNQLPYNAQIIATPVPCCAATPIACFVTPCRLVQAAEVAVPKIQTTLMMRNLPNDYTREMVLELLDAKFFKGCYDFFYLPIDFQTNSGLGYAFVNFIVHAEAERAMSVLNGFCDWRIPSHKILEVTWSELSQGLEANVERYRSSSVFHSSVPEEFQPLVFSHGMRVPFPAPTKPIRQPRLKTMEPAVKTTTLIDPPLRLTPWDRINRTISILNAGNITEIVSNARETLSSKLSFMVPKVADEMHSVGGVCTFHRRLHDALPNLQISLEHVGKEGNGSICWRAACTGTQVKKFIPGLPIDARSTFTLEVTVKDNSNGRPMSVCWNFIVQSHSSVPKTSAEDVTELTDKELLHRNGDCQPCAYFAFRGDGCRMGDDCEFCHLCTKAQAKSKKKQKAQRLKAGMDADSSD